MAHANIKREDLELLDRIGSGTFSTVFKARLHGQEVAAKRLHEPDNHEVEVLATLDHPHIVKLIGTITEKFDFYLVLELCNGGSLRLYLDQKRSENKLLPIYQLHDWAKQAVKPIQYLRSRNLVHKDIKSPNYLIADGNVLKLADFGITKNIESTIPNATQSCSPAWGAPELLKYNILSPSYDISAYGVILWELCTTLVPFEGSSPNHIIWRICKNNERPTIPANCPKPLADLMTKCWEVDWHKRPNPDEILQLLSLAEKQTFIASPSIAEKTYIAGPWKCEKVFGLQEPGELLWPRGIAINPTNQDVAVIDRNSSKLVVYYSTGQFKFSIDLSLRRPSPKDPTIWNVSSVGNYYITTGTQFVYCFNQSGVYISQWASASPDNTPLDSTDSKLCAIDHTNTLLLVGVYSHKYISKHRLNGSHVNSIKVNIRPVFLSVTSQGAIIISDSLTAQIVDQTGQVLHTLKPPSDQVTHLGSWGVCRHEGIIFICNRYASQIACFSEHGDYLGDIPLDVNPYCVTFVPGQKKFFVSGSGKVCMFVS